MPADFIPARVCILICEIILTLPCAAERDTYGTLIDIQKVDILGESSSEHLSSYLSQIGNPYFFRVGSVPVQISFQANGRPLEEKIKSYFMALKI